MNILYADIAEDFKHTYITTMFELRKHMRRRRLLIAAFLAILFPVLFYVVPIAINSPFPEQALLFASNNLGFTEMLIVISSTFFASDAICGELDKRTYLVSFTMPQRRTSFIVGKYAAAFIATGFVISIYYLMILAEMIGIYGAFQIPLGFLTSYLIGLLYTMAAISVAFLFSSLLKSTISSALLVFFTLFMILPIVSGLLTLAKYDNWYVLTNTSSLITGVFGVSTGGAMGGMGGSALNFYVGLKVMASYAIGLFCASLAITLYRGVE
ncbi:MAG: ABC transporter permease [Thermoplasmata archaeon]